MPQQEIILVLAVGKTDVKVVLTNNNQEDVYEVSARNNQEFHTWLEQNIEAIKFASLEELNSKQINMNSRNNAEFKEKKFTIKTKETTTSYPATTDLYFCLPKLMPPLEAIKQKAELKVVGCIIYYTDRRTSPATSSGTARFKENEPFAIGKLVQKWVAATFNLHLPANNQLIQNSVITCNFAEGKSELEGLGRDFPIYRSICQTLEAPLRTANQLYPNSQAFLSIVGGLPSVNSVIQGASKLFFNQVRVLNHPEGSQLTEHLTFNDARNTVNDSYYLRQLINQFIQGYQFSAANLIATQAKEQDILSDGEWAKPLACLSAYLEGKKWPSVQYNKSFPKCYFISESLPFTARSYLLMLRIHLAFIHNHLPLALQLTLALPNAIRLDALERYLLIFDNKYANQQLKPGLAGQNTLNSFLLSLELPKNMNKEVLKELEKELITGNSTVLKQPDKTLSIWNFYIENINKADSLAKEKLIQQLDKPEARTTEAGTELASIYSSLELLMLKLATKEKDKNSLIELASNALVGDLTNQQKKTITQQMLKLELWQQDDNKDLALKNLQLNPLLTQNLMQAFGYSQTPQQTLLTLKEEVARLVKNYQTN